ncbi:MAG: hypothetical protein KGQ88_05420 [Chloroflexi bacterium]|nr:hypothetical protein [Chloroflexota bacterium]
MRSQRSRVVHPFHPLSGYDLELVGYTHTWGEHRVFFRKPGEKRVRSLPASWTDVEPPDPFVVLAAGRSLFRPADLIALVALVREISARERQGDSAVTDKEIMP